uniref:AAA+ ATPase domain-containing protein n=1 Tax=Cucumis melo TaxID=3656 RepID=A0A9I9CIY6_CUCME
MDILISVTAKIAEYTVKPVGRQLGYVFFIHSNFQKLKTQVEKLKITRESVQHKIHSARRNAEDIKPAVEEWLKKVDDFVRESDEILANEGGHGRFCSSNLIQRHKLSRKASQKAYEVLEMKNEGESFDTVSNKNVIPLVDCSLPKVPDFLDFDSRQSIVKQIMDALSDDNVHRIGVYGMGGVGKTMLVKDILRKIVESKKPFDEVVLSTVSQTPDFRSIQGQLADKLGLKFEQETIEGRATILRKRLKMERSILVVLDDVWEYIDLETIGIPSVEDHTGCKILFTTRIKHLISNQMCANKIFEIKVLGKDESWNLFKAMAGDIVDASDLKPIAIRIVRQCAGLPIAITTVAKALRNKPSDIWNDALNQLKSVDVGMANVGEMEKKVYLSLKLSYDCLGYEEVKLLFLLCSMFPEDFPIDVQELHVYAMGMGFLHGVDTVVKGRCRIKKLVDDLISSSLLQQYSEYGCNYVKMHDMVRDVALLIASKNEHVRTLSYVKRSNEEWEEDKLLGNHTAVFIDGLHYPLPKLTLPKVQLLRLVAQYCWEHNKRVSVVETFFEEMKELKGLVVENVNISLMQRPSDLYSLANIRVLHEEIMPKDLFLAEELKLQKFNICIGCQSKLKYTFESTNRIKNFIAIKMESGRCLDDWIKNLLKRSDNVHLEGSICSKFLHLELVGANDFVSFPNLETLEIVNAESLKMIWSNNVPILNSFSKLEVIRICSCNNLQKVLFHPNMMGILTCLKVLEIRDCKLLEGIFEVQEPISVVEASPIVLQNLSRLKLYNLPNLEYVWSKNPCELLSLENIKFLTIDKCPRLRREYSVKILKPLEDVSIDIKHLMEVIVKEKSADHNMLESKQWETSSSSRDGVLRLGDGSKLFPNLKTLKLYGFVDYNSTHLPMEMLQILFQLEDFVLVGASIEEIFPSNILISSDMVLRRLSLSKLPKLKHLWSEECSQNNITSVLQHLTDVSISECGGLSSLVSSLVCFTNLKDLHVNKCHRLTHLLNASVATTLVQLEGLTVEECKRMSSVIEEGSTEEDGNDEMVVFNNLQHLYIFNCSNLTSFYCGRCIIKFPCLRQVDIWNCPEMKVFSLGIVSTPRLKYENFSLENYYDDGQCHPKYPKDMLVEDMNVITREYWEDNVDTRISNLFAEQSLEENQYENSSSSNNNVEKE